VVSGVGSQFRRGSRFSSNPHLIKRPIVKAKFDGVLNQFGHLFDGAAASARMGVPIQFEPPFN